MDHSDGSPTPAFHSEFHDLIPKIKTLMTTFRGSKPSYSSFVSIWKKEEDSGDATIKRIGAFVELGSKRYQEIWLPLQRMDSAIGEMIRTLADVGTPAQAETARKLGEEKSEYQAVVSALGRKVEFLGQLVCTVHAEWSDSQGKAKMQERINMELRGEMEDRLTYIQKLDQSAKVLAKENSDIRELQRKLVLTEAENLELRKRASIVHSHDSETALSIDNYRMQLKRQQLIVDSHVEQTALLQIAMRKLGSHESEMRQLIESLQESNLAKDKRLTEIEAESKKYTVPLIETEGKLHNALRKIELLENENQLFSKKIDFFEHLRIDLELKITNLEQRHSKTSMTATNLELDTTKLVAAVRTLESTNKDLSRSAEVLEQTRLDLLKKLEDAELNVTRLSESLELTRRERDYLQKKTDAMTIENLELVNFKIFSVSGAQKEKNRLEGIIRCYGSVVGPKLKVKIETLEAMYIVQIEELKNEMEIVQGKMNNIEKENTESRRRYEELHQDYLTMGVERYKQLAVQKELIAKNRALQSEKDRVFNDSSTSFKELATLKESLNSTFLERNSLKASVDSVQNQLASLQSERAYLETELHEERLFRKQNMAALNHIADIEKQSKDFKQTIAGLEQQVLSLTADLASKPVAVAPPIVEESTPDPEIEHLSNLVSSQRDIIAHAEEQIKMHENTMKEQISKHDQELSELHVRIRDMEKKEIELKAGPMKQVLINFATAFNQKRREERAIVFLKWLIETVNPRTPLPDSIFELIPQTLTFAEESWDEETLNNFVSVHAFIDQEWRSQMNDSLVSLQYQLRPTRLSTASKSDSCMFFWNQILRTKYREDERDFTECKKPKTLCEFLIYCLQTTHSIAREKLTHHMLGLYEAYQRQEPFSILISRLLQVIDPSPTSLEAQIVVMQYAYQFDELCGDSGLMGTLSLSTLLDSFFDVINAKEYIGEHWFHHLCPGGVLPKDFIVFIIYWRLAREGKKPEEFWRRAKPRGLKEMTLETLEVALHEWGIMMNLGLIDQACPFTKQYYGEKSRILESADTFQVTKSKFLIGVLESCLAKVRRVSLSAHSRFLEIASESISKDQFLDMLSETSSVSPETLEKIYQEGMLMTSSPEGLDHSSFVRLMSRRMLGTDGDPPLSEPRVRELFETRE